MVRQRTAATAGLLAAGTVLPFLFASPALAAPGQSFTGQGSATFLTVNAGVDTAALAPLLLAVPGLGGLLGALPANVDQLVDVQVGQSAADTESLGTPQSFAAANAVNADLAGLLAVGTDLAEVTATAPADLGPNTDQFAGVALPGVLNAGVITNSAAAADLDANLCLPAGTPTAEGSSTTASAALLPTGLGATSVLSTTAVEAGSRTGLVTVPGLAGLGAQTIAELGTAQLSLLDGLPTETTLSLTAGELVATADGPTTGTVVYTPPTLTVDSPIAAQDGVLAPGSTLVIPVVGDPGLPLPVVNLVITLNGAADVTGDVTNATVDVLDISLVLDADGSLGALTPLTLLDVTLGSLAVNASTPAGGVICTPPTTPPTTAPPVVDPIVTPVTPAALANTGADPLPLIGLGVGLLAVGGAAMGAGPLRRKLASTQGTPHA